MDIPSSIPKLFWLLPVASAHYFLLWLSAFTKPQTDVMINGFTIEVAPSAKVLNSTQLAVLDPSDSIIGKLNSVKSPNLF